MRTEEWAAMAKLKDEYVPLSVGAKKIIISEKLL
jgi:hypothetical protein